MTTLRMLSIGSLTSVHLDSAGKNLRLFVKVIRITHEGIGGLEWIVFWNKLPVYETVKRLGSPASRFLTV